MTVLDPPDTLAIGVVTTTRRAAAAALIGRDSELRALRGTIDAINDEGAAVVIRGEPGTGKSSLLSAAAEHARMSGCLVLRVAGIEAESTLPYAGLHALLAPLLTGAAYFRLPSVAPC